MPSSTSDSIPITSNKTTITNLINRFYDIQEGVITYDGIDIKRIKKDDLRKSKKVPIPRELVNTSIPPTRVMVAYSALFIPVAAY